MTASPPVIDAHTHMFSDEVHRDRTSLLDREPWFGLLYQDPKAKLATPAELLAAADTAGVSKVVACGFPWIDLGRCRAENEAAAAAAGDRLAWMAMIPPAGGAKAAQELDRSFSSGACALGEINADAQRFDLRDPEALAPIIEVCLAHDRPVLLHASEPVGHAYPGKGTATPETLLTFLRAFPTLKVVLAHWGGGMPFYELMPEVAEACRNVCYDTAASTYLYRPQVFRSVVDLVGLDRVLWGSDYPVLGMAKFLQRTRESSGMQTAELPALLAGNATRVYRLRSPQGASTT